MAKGIHRRKSWTEKMDNGREAVVKRTDSDFADIPAGSTMLIATPRIVESYIRHIPSGREADTSRIRKDLAAEYGAEYTCPVTTGIFLRIVAEAAYEQWQSGTELKDITPFWRAVGPTSPTARKLSFPHEFLMEQRRREGLE
jgi:hypothetical protein